jgi:hypothetical protein
MDTIRETKDAYILDEIMKKYLIELDTITLSMFV